jgi:hypothetical protein
MAVRTVERRTESFHAVDIKGNRYVIWRVMTFLRWFEDGNEYLADGPQRFETDDGKHAHQINEFSFLIERVVVRLRGRLHFAKKRVAETDMMALNLS